VVENTTERKNECGKREDRRPTRRAPSEKSFPIRGIRTICRVKFTKGQVEKKRGRDQRGGHHHLKVRRSLKEDEEQPERDRLPGVSTSRKSAVKGERMRVKGKRGATKTGGDPTT